MKNRWSWGRHFAKSGDGPPPPPRAPTGAIDRPASRRAEVTLGAMHVSSFSALRACVGADDSWKGGRGVRNALRDRYATAHLNSICPTPQYYTLFCQWNIWPKLLCLGSFWEKHVKIPFVFHPGFHPLISKTTHRLNIYSFLGEFPEFHPKQLSYFAINFIFIFIFLSKLENLKKKKIKNLLLLLMNGFLKILTTQQ